MANKIELTYKDFNLINSEYENLINVERPKNLEDLKEARAQGDLSENAEYDAARDRQREIEGRIKEIEYTNKICVVLIGAEEYKKVENEYNSIRTSEDKTVALRRAKLEIIVNSHKIVDSSSNLNKYITITFEDTGDVETYYICGTIESDPLNGKISNECPLGDALLNGKVGEKVLIVSETEEKYYVTINAISSDKPSK